MITIYNDFCFHTVWWLILKNSFCDWWMKVIAPKFRKNNGWLHYKFVCLLQRKKLVCWLWMHYWTSGQYSWSSQNYYATETYFFMYPKSFYLCITGIKWICPWENLQPMVEAQNWMCWIVLLSVFQVTEQWDKKFLNGQNCLWWYIMIWH